MNYDLSQKIMQSAVTDELVDSMTITPVQNKKLVPLTAEERAARQERRQEREENAYETSENGDRAWVKAAFEEDTSGGSTRFEMGGGDDVFHFGNWGKKHLAGEALEVDMGRGDGDIVRFANSIEDYTFIANDDGSLRVINQTSGVEITFEGAEEFVFLNRTNVDGVRVDLQDTTFSADEMLYIASGAAQAEMHVAEYMADMTMSMLGIDAGADGVYVDVTTGQPDAIGLPGGFEIG